MFRVGIGPFSSLFNPARAAATAVIASPVSQIFHSTITATTWTPCRSTSSFSVEREISELIYNEGDAASIKHLFSSLSDEEKRKYKANGYMLKRVVKRGDPEIIGCILETENGYDPNDLFSFHGSTSFVAGFMTFESADMSAFEYAVFLGNPAVVKTFIDSGKVETYSPAGSLYRKEPLIHAAIPLPLARHPDPKYNQVPLRIPLEADTPIPMKHFYNFSGITFKPYQYKEREEVALLLIRTLGIRRLGGSEAIRHRATLCGMMDVLKLLNDLEKEGPEEKGTPKLR